MANPSPYEPVFDRLLEVGYVKFRSNVVKTSIYRGLKKLLEELNAANAIMEYPLETRIISIKELEDKVFEVKLVDPSEAENFTAFASKFQFSFLEEDGDDS